MRGPHKEVYFALSTNTRGHHKEVYFALSANTTLEAKANYTLSLIWVSRVCVCVCVSVCAVSYTHLTLPTMPDV